MDRARSGLIFPQRFSRLHLIWENIPFHFPKVLQQFANGKSPLQREFGPEVIDLPSWIHYSSLLYHGRTSQVSLGNGGSKSALTQPFTSPSQLCHCLKFELPPCFADFERCPSYCAESLQLREQPCRVRSTAPAIRRMRLALPESIDINCMTMKRGIKGRNLFTKR